MKNLDFARTKSWKPAFFSSQVREARWFYLDLAPPSDVPLAVVCGGCEVCQAEYAIHRSTFAYTAIEFVAQGRGRLTLAGQSCDLLPGSVFSYANDIAHDITTDPKQPLVKYFVNFTGQRGLDLLQQLGLAPGNRGQVFAPVEIQDVFDRLIENGLKATRYSNRLCATLVEYLIVKIAESLVPGEATQTPSFATYRRCRQHIQTQHARLKSLGQIAKECHVDPAYLCRLFGCYDHQSPYQFLLRLKMNLAAERLQNPATLVKQVAAELGFADAFHFSRAFKKVLGVSPQGFRRLR
ncbi:MAG: AraC family transcriptional regulator [Thermoguttaceae bacterium]|jgi:AraC-like DNA-binding protein